MKPRLDKKNKKKDIYCQLFFLCYFEISFTAGHFKAQTTKLIYPVLQMEVITTP